MFLKQFFFREGVACSFLSNRLFGVVVRAFPDGVVVRAFPDGVVVRALSEELVVCDFSKELVVRDFYEDLAWSFFSRYRFLIDFQRFHHQC